MTRETKVGLVVAGSFLCLVCIVVASKMRGNDAAKVAGAGGPPGTTESSEFVGPPKPAATHPTDGKPPEAPKRPPTQIASATVRPGDPETDHKAGQKLPNPAAPAKANDGHDNGALPPLVIPSPEKASIPSPEQVAQDLKHQMQLAAQNQPKQNPFPLPPDLPNSPNVKNPFEPSLDNKVPAAGVVPPVNIGLPDTVKNQGDSFPALPPGPIDGKKNDGTNLPIPSAANTGNPGIPAPIPLTPPKKEDTLPPLQLGQQGGNANPTNPTPNGIGGFPMNSLPDVTKPTTAPPIAPLPLPPRESQRDTFQVPLNNDPPPFGSAPLKESKPFAPVNDPFAPPPITNTPSLNTPPFMNAPAPNPIIGAQPLPSTPAITMNAPNQMTFPAIPQVSINGVNPRPVVTMTEPDVVQVKPGETNFAQLSNRLYGTDRYADALLAYNRSHPRAVANGVNFTGPVPTLIPGQQVLHPPVNILEREHRNLIGGGAQTSLVPATATGSVPVVNLAQPVPITSTGQPVVTPSTGPGRVYTVASAGGERIRDIAQRTLGDANRWTEIYRLNPNLQPQFAIPTGTPLKLP